tara:strand:- start:264 stop:617 length:354 start_codon:yes stop_codon:yes gene_type:complete
MDNGNLDLARSFIVKNILSVEDIITEHKYAISQGALPIRDISSELKEQMSILHSLLSGIDTGALVAVYDDGEVEPKFMMHPETENNQEVSDAWAEVNDMLENSFFADSEEWYSYIMS